MYIIWKYRNVTAGAVPRGGQGSHGPQVKFLPTPLCPPPSEKKFKIRPSLAKIFRKLALHALVVTLMLSCFVTF